MGDAIMKAKYAYKEQQDNALLDSFDEIPNTESPIQLKGYEETQNSFHSCDDNDLETNAPTDKAEKVERSFFGPALDDGESKRNDWFKTESVTVSANDSEGDTFVFNDNNNANYDNVEDIELSGKQSENDKAINRTFDENQSDESENKKESEEVGDHEQDWDEEAVDNVYEDEKGWFSKAIDSIINFFS